MVAITVILAAVIGTFVLDLGQDVGQSAPQASLSVSVDQPASNLTISHNGGEALVASDTRVLVSVGGSSQTWNSTTAGGSGTFTVGEEVELNLDTVANSSVDAWDSTITTADGAITLGAGDQVTVRVIDIPSQKLVFETTVTA